MLINALRAHLAEFGIIMRQGRASVAVLMASVEEGKAEHLPELARTALMSLIAQLRDPLPPAQLGDRVLAAELRNHDPDILFRRVFISCTSGGGSRGHAVRPCRSAESVSSVSSSSLS
jgi:hypothetical protein